MKKLSVILLRSSFLTIYRAFVILHLNYTNTIYDKARSEIFKDWLEKF